MDQNADAGTAVLRLEFEEVERSDRASRLERLDDEAHLARLVDVELLLVDEALQLMAREGGQRAADVPDRGVVLPTVHRLNVVGFDGAQADEFAFESHVFRFGAGRGVPAASG